MQTKKKPFRRSGKPEDRMQNAEKSNCITNYETTSLQRMWGKEIELNNFGSE